jgi:dTMP kinase
MLIDIEGIDGSGKGTQAVRLCDRLKSADVPATVVSFPRYSATLFGRAVGEFLNGRFGTLREVHPFLVSLLFAGDRFESRPTLLETMNTSSVVVLDRYVASNVAHQASKLDGADQAELTRRILEIEFTIFEMPRPDLVLLLDLPVRTAQKLIAQKAARNYTSRSADIQEADGRYLERVREVYLGLARAETNWRTIACCDGDRLRSVEEIGDAIWEAIDLENLTGPVIPTNQP